METFNIEKDCTYRIIDCEYFPMLDTLYLHIVEKDISGTVKKIYHKIDNPTYSFYLSDQYDRIYYEKKENLKLISNVRYLYRFNEIGKLLNVDMSNLKSKDWDIKSSARSELMSSGRLFNADQDITYVYIQKAIKFFEDKNVYDLTIRGKTLYADIETAFDFEETGKIYALENSNDNQYEYGRNTKSNKMVRYALDNIVGYEDELKVIFDAEKMIQAPGRVHTLALEYARYCPVEEFKKIRLYFSKIKREYASYQEVNENLSMNRIETITYYSPNDKILQHNYLIRPESFDESMAKEYISNTEKFNELYTKYFRIIRFKVDISTLGKLEKKEIGKLYGESFLSDFKDAVNFYGKNTDYNKFEEIHSKIINDFILNKLDKYATVPEFNYKMNIFFNEADMIIDYFNKLKFEIMPSYHVFHNNKFDLLYLKGRLDKLGYDSASAFVMYPMFDIESAKLDFFKQKFRIDDTADTVKASKTNLTGWGLIECDTMGLRAKQNFREIANGLDAALNDEFGEEKFKYAAPSISTLYNHPDHFIKYSNIDTLMLEPLDTKLGLISGKQSMLEGNTGWRSAFTVSEITTNNLRTVFDEEFGLILQNNPNSYLYSVGQLETFGLVGAYVSNPETGKTVGISRNICSVDASAMYPSIMQQGNTLADQFILNFNEAKTLETMLQDPLKYLIEEGALMSGELEKMLLS